MYAFACLVLERFAMLSAWSNAVNTAAVLASVVFFALAVGSYILHGWLRDTRNQLQSPHKLGRVHVPGAPMLVFMLLLILAEVGGFLVLFAGFALR